jgi:hypothetical protein
MAKAATGLISARASWLAREHFARFIRVGASINDPGTKLASIDWEAAISALDAGELPSSGGFSEQMEAELQGWHVVAGHGHCRSSPGNRPSGECSASQPVSLTRHLSALAKPSPASTIVTWAY